MNHTHRLTYIHIGGRQDNQNNTSLLNESTNLCSNFNHPPIINWIPRNIGLTLFLSGWGVYDPTVRKILIINLLFASIEAPLFVTFPKQYS